MTYCTPLNRTASGYTETCRRLANLLQCLDAINASTVDGEIIYYARRFRDSLRLNLENEGWSFSYDGGPKLKVRHPSHAHPFPKGTRLEP